MNNKEILQSNNERISVNNTNLNTVLNMINNLPEAGTTGENVKPLYLIKESNNIYNIDNYDDTYFYDGNGVQSIYEGYGSTGFMEVGEYEKDVTQFHYPYQATGFLTFWDSNKNFIGGETSAVYSGFTIPYENCAFINMAIPTNYSNSFYMYKKYAYEVAGEYLNISDAKIPNSQKNNLYNKKLVVLGDSITQGFLANVPYVNYISANNLCFIKNYGISRSTISNGKNASDPMCVRYTKMDDDADYVFVMGGTNDFGNFVEIGTNDSTDTATFKGALNVLIEGLINKYPNSKIGFSTPIPAKYNDWLLEKNLKLYVNAMIEICQKWSIPCLNLFGCSRINPNNTTILNNYFSNDIIDGVHPDENGQKIIAEIIESFLNNLYVTENNSYNFVKLTQTEYDSLASKNENTIYLIEE